VTTKQVKVDVLRARKIAEDLMAKHDEWDRFWVEGWKGLVECRWEDPYFGVFRIVGHEGTGFIDKLPITEVFVAEELVF
jgi:hypothetical protein